MTNVSSGSKRPWEGSNGTDSYKRSRDDPATKDWRDVHLKSPASGRRSSADRRRDDRRPRSRDYDHRRRPSDYGHRHERDRRDDRDRDRKHDRDRSREYRDKDRGPTIRREDSRRSEHPSPTTPRSSNHVGGLANGTPQPQEEAEREEGEISPRHSPVPMDISKPATAEQPAAEKKPETKTELDLVTTPPPVEDTLAARRARRQAIMAKYAGVSSINTSQAATPSPGPSSAVIPPPALSARSDNLSQPQSAHATPELAELHIASSKRESLSASPTPANFELLKNDDQADAKAKVQVEHSSGEQISAADYDPSLDRREDEQKRVLGAQDGRDGNVEEVIEEEVEEEEDVDDMFAALTGEKKVKKVKRVVKKPAVPALITTTLDSAADPEGYYQVILGEQLDGGRYQVFSSLGKGMFANVVKARVLQGELGEIGKEVAIKIIRAQESMYRAGQKEAQILQKLRQADPEDKKHVVRLDRTFEHRGHLCLVFESLSMNLREVVKRFGKDVGLNIRAVRAYAHQLFLAMSLLRKCNIMHADIKPDNILVNEQKTVLKLCDLGSASDASENDITPYLVSRFYRAPEIILGVPYDPALDIWSIGCTLYELYTGKILFPGRSNNHMLLLMMELKGRFNSKMIKKAKFGDVYFDDLGGFQSVETDRVTGTDVVRQVHITKPSRDLRSRLMPPTSTKLKDDEMKILTSFIDLLDKCLALDPSKRITPKEALVHPFIRG
ncbi:kinase-like domain-containing protein [Irpex lacteus]|nr:kinase-like domain-containing protein [Irpex lacteus]